MKFSILKVSGAFICALCFVLSSCQKDDEVGPSAEKRYSKFIGIAWAYDDRPDNVKVTIRNGKFVRDTQTDENGQFAFDSLESGTYNLTFVKEGFGIYKAFGIRHFGYPSDTAFKVYAPLYKKATSTVEKVGIIRTEDYTYDRFLKVELGIANIPAEPEYVIAFVSRNPDVSKDSYEFYLTTSYSNFWISDLQKTFTGVTFSYSQIVKKGYKNGDKLYFKFYTIHRYDMGYNDFDLKTQVFPSISSNQVPVKEHVLSF